MQDQRGFGVITSQDVQNELVSRGITVGVGLPAPPDEIPEAPVIPPEAPQEPIVVVAPRGEIDYEPYIPIYPPPIVTLDVAEEEEEEEILPFIPAEIRPEAKKGINKGLLAVMGVAAFALIALGAQEPGTRRSEEEVA